MIVFLVWVVLWTLLEAIADTNRTKSEWSRLGKLIGFCFLYAPLGNNEEVPTKKKPLNSCEISGEKLELLVRIELTTFSLRVIKYFMYLAVCWFLIRGKNPFVPMVTADSIYFCLFLVIWFMCDFLVTVWPLVWPFTWPTPRTAADGHGLPHLRRHSSSAASRMPWSLHTRA